MSHLTLLKRLWVGLGTAAAVGAIVAAPASAQTGIDLPDTTTGVHVGAPFLRCYEETWEASGAARSGCPASGAQTSITSLEGKVDVGFMWNYGVNSPQQMGTNINLGAALKFDRFPGYAVNSPRYPAGAPVTLSDWEQSHPDWIEYTCATNSAGQHTTPAWEFGNVPSSPSAEAYVPFNVADPNVRQYFFDTYVKPSLDNGYKIIFLDNVIVAKNNFDRCGHYDAQGQWVQQYTGATSDSAYQADMLSWLTWLRDQIHAYAPNALLALNYNAAQDDDPPALYEQVYKIADLIWEEGGFTNWGTVRLSGAAWNREFMAMSYLAGQSDRGVIINGIAGGHESTSPSQISADDRQWIVANYLLVKGAHTYTDITPNYYGSFYDFPEYHIPIGSPQGSAYQDQDLWMRNFTGGLAIVNPDTKAHTITVPAGYTNTDGQPVQGSVTLNPTTGLVLLSSTASSVGSGSNSAASADAHRASALLGSTKFALQFVGKPSLSHTSLKGLPSGKPQLAFTLTAGTHAQPVRTIAVHLASGLRFSTSKARLKRGIVVIGASGKHVRFTAKVRRGVLTVGLHTAASKVRITIASPEIAVHGSLTRTVKRKHASRLRFRVQATDTGRSTTSIPLSLKTT